MTEVARALLLPSIEGPSLSTVLSAILVWDRVLIPPRYVKAAADESQDELVLGRLRDAGVIDRVELDIDRQTVERPDVWTPMAEALGSGILAGEPRPILLDRVRAAMREGAYAVADHQTARLRSAVAAADSVGAAPLANGLYGLIAPILPAPSPGTAVREATLISLATPSLAVDGSTEVDAVLAFRATHALQMGRFRAAMIDLASTMRQDAAPQAMLEEAHALLKNRLEPALGELESALRASRIGFAWKAVVGASTVAAIAPLTPAATIGTAGIVTTRLLSYVFDRDKLARDHPLGYIHQIRRGFSGETRDDVLSAQWPISDPIDEMRRFYWLVLDAAGTIPTEHLVDSALAIVASTRAAMDAGPP